VLLGRGIPLVSAEAPRSRLTLTRSESHPSGIVSLHYDVERANWCRFRRDGRVHRGVREQGSLHRGHARV